jgi:membrane-bound ClpP family serine protease
VLFSRSNLFRCSRLAACLAAFLLAAGCATHKTVPPAPVSYPPAPETALQELRGLPPGPYDRLVIITIAAEVGPQLDAAIKGARQSAAQKGANALVVLRNTEYRQKVGKRTVRVRRTTYLAIHRR